LVKSFSWLSHFLGIVIFLV